MITMATMRFENLIKKYFKDNIGLVNLIGKSFGRLLFLILISFFAYKLSTKDFADFAIFWSTLRLFTFYSSNNLYIIYFEKVRDALIDRQSWLHSVSSNIVITTIVFGLISSVLGFFIFDRIVFSITIIPCLVMSLIIRYLSEFAKSDNNLSVSIFIEDFLYYILFFIFSIIGINFIDNSAELIAFSLTASLLITAIVCLYLFKNKFHLKIHSYKINLKDFSFEDFKLGLNYTFLRGNEALSNFAVRYLGQIYFGDVFVAYIHIMYQFYNIFNLLTVSVISGFQSKITIRSYEKFSKTFLNKMYIKVVKTILPFSLILFVILVVFGKQILELIFPKQVEYNVLLIKVSLVGLLTTLVQPLVFILIYNNKMSKVLKLNYFQYALMLTLFSMPYFTSFAGEQYWFLMIISSFLIVQGIYSWLIYNNIK